MFLKRMRVNMVLTAIMLFILFLYEIYPAMAYGSIALFFVYNILLEWEEDCERRDLDAYNRHIE